MSLSRFARSVRLPRLSRRGHRVRQGAKLSARAAVVALIVGLVCLAEPAPTPAEAASLELWSADLTVGNHSSEDNYGYNFNDSYGSLSPSHFTYGGGRYTTRSLGVEYGSLTLGFFPDIPFKNDLTLIVGDKSFSASAATTIVSGSMYWANPGLTWAVADTVSVSLTANVPGQPADFTATPGNEQVTLGWTDPSDSTITGYQVQRNGGAWTDITDSSATTVEHIVTGLANGTEYRFAVRAVIGTFSGEATATETAPRTVPGAPGNVAAAPREGGALLTWEAPASDGGAPITGYEWAGGWLTGWQPVPNSDVDTRSCDVPGLTNGQSYTLQVGAVNAAGSGAETSASAVTPVALPVAVTISATRGDGSVTLSWTDPSDSTITRWEVRQDDGAWEAISESTVSTTSHTVTKLTNGTEYTFEIRAVNVSGAGTASNQVSATPAGLPLAPTGFSATGGNTVAILRWSAADDKGSPITKYQYQQDDGAWTDIAMSAPGGANAVSFTVDNLANGIGYTFKLRAVNDVGDGAESAEDTATPQLNARPVVTHIGATIDEDSAVTIEVLKNVTDADNDPLTVSSVSDPAHGTAVIVPGAQTVTYTPNADYNGRDSFTYEVSDGQGDTVTGTVTVTVRPVNDAPVAVVDSATTKEDEPVIIDVLENDSDPVEGDTLTIERVSDPAHGAARVANGGITYTPGADYHDRDSFTYTVTDGGATASATVTVTVTAVNDPPVAARDSAETDEDTAVTIPVLANDSDAEGNPLTVSSVSDPAHGTAVIVPGAQTVTYTPDADYHGRDTFTYTVSDGRGATVTGTVLVWVYAPVATSGTQTTHGVLPGVRTVAGNPQGTLNVEFAQGSSGSAPFQVRLDHAAQGCGAPPAGLALVTCVQVELFDLNGTPLAAGSQTLPFNSAILNVVATSTQGIRVYRRDGPEVAWTEIPECSDEATRECFTVSGNEVTIRNIGRFSQFAVMRPQSTSAVIIGGGTVRRRNRRAPAPTATVTPSPTVPAPTVPVFTPTPVPPTPPLVIPTPGEVQVAPTVVQRTPELPTSTPPLPSPTAVAGASATIATATPAPVAAMPATIQPPTAAAPPAVDESGRGFSVWLVAVIAVAAVVAIGLGIGGWRLLRR